MPIDRGHIDQQLHTLQEGSRWWDVRELRDLPSVMHEDERILAISHGRIARVRWLRRSWLILVTDQRLLCLRSHRDEGWRQLEAAASQVTGVSLRIGPRRGRVRVTAGGRKYRLLVPRPDAHKLLSALSLLSSQGTITAQAFGPTRMVRQVFDHILALPAAALDPGPQNRLPGPVPDRFGLVRRVESLEETVRELGEHVDFLEQLLRDRHEAAAPAEPG